MFRLDDENATVVHAFRHNPAENRYSLRIDLDGARERKGIYPPVGESTKAVHKELEHL